MCLYVGNKITLVSDKDITVYKLLRKEDDKYMTPCQNVVVTLNKTIKPNKAKEVHEKCNNKYQISSGVIHSYTSVANNASEFFFEAIIPAGTKYYMQDDFKEIASEQLYISDKQVINDIKSPDFNTMLTDYLKVAFNTPEYQNKDGIRIGYVKLSTGEYVNPFDDFDKTKAIGVVAFFNKDKPVIVALESKSLPWLTEYNMNNQIYSQTSTTNHTNDFDGKKHCNDISSGKDYNHNNFKAIAYCLDYKTEGTNNGDWYLGSTGEMVKVSQNVGLVNSVILLCGIGTPIDLVWHWTSSESKEGSFSFAWYCYINDGNCYCNYNGRVINRCVRPLAAL